MDCMTEMMVPSIAFDDFSSLLDVFPASDGSDATQPVTPASALPLKQDPFLFDESSLDWDSLLGKGIHAPLIDVSPASQPMGIRKAVSPKRKAPASPVDGGVAKKRKYRRVSSLPSLEGIPMRHRQLPKSFFSEPKVNTTAAGLAMQARLGIAPVFEAAADKPATVAPVTGAVDAKLLFRLFDGVEQQQKVVLAAPAPKKIDFDNFGMDMFADECLVPSLEGLCGIPLIDPTDLSSILSELVCTM
eukprot:Opistho-1_new@59470